MNRKSIKSPAEIEAIAEGGKILGKILKDTAKLVRAGVSTFELNEYAEKAIITSGGKPSFVGYGSRKNPYPAGLCTSVNDAVVHGIPSKEDILVEGDILGLDIGMIYKGFYTDTAVTVPVGKISPEANKLLATTKKALDLAIKEAKIGARMGDIGNVIEKTAKEAGFDTVRDLVGHGVGYAVHEDPSVPGYGKAGTGMLLEENMVLAIEPMFTQNKAEVYFDTDGWTVRTHDGALAAHFEHTIAITKKGARVLT